MSTGEIGDGLSHTIAGAATMRIATLHKTDSFYPPLEDRFERITRLGKNAMGVRATGVTLIVPDTHKAPRYKKLPLVVGNPRFRFYAGYPL
jgi:GAF domain-containing protein